MEMNPEFWSGKRVFVTGHTGFKGGWLCLWLQHLGAKVTGYALNPPTIPSLFKVAQVGKGMTSVVGDVQDHAYLSEVLRQSEPEIVIHMAAQPLVRRSYLDPVSTYSVNVMGTVNLLEALRKTASVRVFLNVTTDKCYENKEWVWAYRENDTLGGVDPYSSSKSCAELVTSAYQNSYFNPSLYQVHKLAIASARAGNVIGGGDWAEDRLIPDILRAIEAKKSVNIRNPHAERPWQHVLEALSGYLLLAEKLYTDGPTHSGAFNFGPVEADSKPVEWIVKQLAEKWSHTVSWQIDRRNSPHEAHYLRLDCSKAHQMLGWRPKWSLYQSLDAVVVWHKKYAETKDIEAMRTMCFQQIKAYMEKFDS